MVAWVLNLDADLELGAPARYAPTRAVRDAMAEAGRVVARSLLGPLDVLVDDHAPPGSARGHEGRAFCPTPRALAMLEVAGATLPKHPSVEVLRRVNGRAFCASLGPTLPGARFETDESAAFATLAHPPPPGFSAWRVKRAFGMAGRGQRVVTPGASTRADTELVRAAIATGGVMIEPQVTIVEELALHAMLAEDGSFETGVVCTQRTDAHGAWIATERRALRDEPALALERELVRVAAALYEAGYFGPFGVDAFVYRDGCGALAFQPRGEINARYSMGFAVGFGAGEPAR